MSEDDPGDAFQYFTREEALRVARAAALRDLAESETVISYVAFVEGFDDFCFCEFRYEAPHGWTQRLRMLANDQRRPGEEITDARIVDLARAGKLVTALRLYRGKYGVGLAEARAGVDRLVRDAGR